MLARSADAARAEVLKGNLSAAFTLRSRESIPLLIVPHEKWMKREMHHPAALVFTGVFC
jgi:hypothetical protein